MFISTVSELLKEKKNFDISYYKENFLERRLSLRLNSLNIRKIENYLELLERNEEEVENLINLLTIHVSQFFRNPDLFQELKSLVLPEVFKRNFGEYYFLSAGCAGGEEAYSLAMLLLENFRPQLDLSVIKIYGVDISEEAIRKAREGIYTEREISTIPSGFRNKYFEKIGKEKYIVSEELKKMVEFKRMNLFVDTLPQKISLLLCRNLLIYLRRDAQITLLRKLMELLEPGAFLVLGKTEGILNLMDFDNLEPLKATKRIYIYNGGVHGGNKKED